MGFGHRESKQKSSDFETEPVDRHRGIDYNKLESFSNVFKPDVSIGIDSVWHTVHTQKEFFMYHDFLSIWGDPSSYSPGLSALTANRHLQYRQNKFKDQLQIEDVGNGKAVIRDIRTGKWFLDSDTGVQSRYAEGFHCMMLGAICGDVAGSVYEWHNVKYCIDTDKLISPRAHFTDDSVMTIAVANGIRIALSKLPPSWLGNEAMEQEIFDAVRASMQLFGRQYPNAGYGGSFRRWLADADPQPYNSWGNGSAMRASYGGWVAKSLAEAERLGEISAAVTHNHPEGIKGAKAVTGGIYTLRVHGDKKAFEAYIKDRYYSLDFTLDEIREDYRFDVSCQGSVPQAIEAFLEGESFSDVISKAISIGGDSDTIAAIAASFAEVIYPIPEGVRGRVIDRLDCNLRDTLIDAIDFAVQAQQEP